MSLPNSLAGSGGATKRQSRTDRSWFWVPQGVKKSIPGYLSGWRFMAPWGWPIPAYAVPPRISDFRTRTEARNPSTHNRPAYSVESICITSDLSQKSLHSFLPFILSFHFIQFHSFISCIRFIHFNSLHSSIPFIFHMSFHLISFHFISFHFILWQTCDK